MGSLNKHTSEATPINTGDELAINSKTDLKSTKGINFMKSKSVSEDCRLDFRQQHISRTYSSGSTPTVASSPSLSGDSTVPSFTDRGPRRDLVALGHCQLDSESDRLPGGHHHGERLHVNDVRTADRFIRPLTEAVLDLVDPDVPGGGEAEEGEEREQLHDEQSPC